MFAEGGEVGGCHCCSTHDRPTCKGCLNYAQGGEVGGEFDSNPAKAVEHAIFHTGLHHALTKVGTSKSPDPHRAHEDLKSSHDRGRAGVKSLSKDLVEGKIEKRRPEGAQDLHDHLNRLQNAPEEALDVGGTLALTHPDHALHLANKVPQATQYLQSIKPHPQQSAPLDKPVQPSRLEMAHYDRQVHLVQHPSMIYEHARRGDITPQDVSTLAAVYPHLLESFKEHAFEALAEHKKSLSLSQVRGISALLGQTLTSIQTPQASQAIIKANAPQQPPGSQPKKASGTELTQINKVNELDQTSFQSRQADKVSK